MDVLLNLSKPCDSSSARLRITMPVSRIVVFGQSILAPNTGVHIVGAQLIVTSSVIVVIMVITESVLSQYSHSFHIYFLSTCCNTCWAVFFALGCTAMTRIIKVPVSGRLDKHFTSPLLSSFASQCINFWPSTHLFPFPSIPLSSTRNYRLLSCFARLTSQKARNYICHLSCPPAGPHQLPFISSSKQHPCHLLQRCHRCCAICWELAHLSGFSSNATFPKMSSLSPPHASQSPPVSAI